MDKKMMAVSTAMLVLKLLEESDLYGYEMIRKLEEQSENVFSLKEGTLYPLLHSLEQKNCLLSYEKEVLGKRRKYYQITREGRDCLKEKQREWEMYSTAVGKVLGGVSFGY